MHQIFFWKKNFKFLSDTSAFLIRVESSFRLYEKNLSTSSRSKTQSEVLASWKIRYKAVSTLAGVKPKSPQVMAKKALLPPGLRLRLSSSGYVRVLALQVKWRGMALCSSLAGALAALRGRGVFERPLKSDLYSLTQFETGRQWMRILLTIVSWLASSAFRIDSISFYLGQVRKASTKSIIIQPLIHSDCWNRIFPSTSTASSVLNIMVRIHQLYNIYFASICLKLLQPRDLYSFSVSVRFGPNCQKCAIN